MEENVQVNRLRHAAILLGGVTLFRLVFNAAYPLDVSGDEAYYWDWGRRFDWGYFSKPPLIGWTMGLLRLIGADTGFGLRTASTLLGTAGLSVIYLLMARLFNTPTAFLAVAVLVATVGNAALNICMTTDAWLLLCWFGALYCFWRFTETEALRWSLATALCIGVGLLAKQMMVLFFPLALIYLTLDRHALLKHPLTWLTGLLPLLFLIPPLVWNARNGWITFRHTGGHFSQEGVSVMGSLTNFAEFIGGQLGLVSPVLFVLTAWVLVKVVRAWRQCPSALRYLAVYALPLAGFALFSFRKEINPNWPLLFDAAGLLVLAGYAGLHGRLVRPCRIGVAVGAVLTAVFYIALVAVPLSGIDFSRVAPLRQVSGWSEYGARTGLAHAGLPTPEDTMLIACGHRYYASALAFYHPQRPVVFHWHPDPHVNSQYDLWPQPSSTGKDALIVVPKKTESIPESLAERFSEVRRVTAFEIPAGGRRPKNYTLFHGVDWRDE